MHIDKEKIKQALLLLKGRMALTHNKQELNRLHKKRLELLEQYNKVLTQKQ